MFANRVDAGERLSQVLQGLSIPGEKLILGIPRGGIVVADVISRRMDIPMGSLLVKKIGAPYNPELAIGAVGEGDIVYWDQEVLAREQVSADAKRLLKDKAEKSLKEREEQFNLLYTRHRIGGKTVLLVDDGVATGATAICAAAVARHFGAEHIFLATPVIPLSVSQEVRRYVTEIVTLETAKEFGSVGQWYMSFSEVTDEEVKILLTNGEENHSKHM